MQRKKGEITVFLSLILSVLCMLISMGVRNIGYNIAKLKAKTILKTSLHSVFAEYEPYLYERFNLMLIDPSYKREDADVENTIRHLSQYMEINSRTEGNPMEIEIRNIELIECVRAGDDDCLALMNEICDCVDSWDEGYDYDYYPVDSTDENTQYLEEYLYKWGNALEEDELGHYRDSCEELYESAGYDAYMGLQIVAGDGRMLNIVERDSSCYRDIGYGETDEKLDEYLLTHLSKAGKESEESVLGGELEYILYGCPSDEDNICLFIKDIVAERLRINESIVFGEAWDYEDGILYSLAYAESLLEADCLMHGDHVAADKQDSDMILGVHSFGDYRDYFGMSNMGEISSKDIYAGFMRQVCREDKLYRLADIIEADMKEYVNPHFEIDECISYLEFEVDVVGGYGYEEKQTAAYGYRLPYGN